MNSAQGFPVLLAPLLSVLPTLWWDITVGEPASQPCRAEQKEWSLQGRVSSNKCVCVCVWGGGVLKLTWSSPGIYGMVPKRKAEYQTHAHTHSLSHSLTVLAVMTKHILQRYCPRVAGYSRKKAFPKTLMTWGQKKGSLVCLCVVGWGWEGGRREGYPPQTVNTFPCSF
jgi:hypothetical protein